MSIVYRRKTKVKEGNDKRNCPMSRTPQMPLLIGSVKILFSISMYSGTPGSVWTKEQVEVVREKVREMVNVNNWWGVDKDIDIIDIDIDIDV